MKELFKSKTMILFMVMVLGVVYFNSSHVHKLESTTVEDNIVASNIN